MKRFASLFLIAVMFFASSLLVATAPRHEPTEAALSGECHYQWFSPWIGGTGSYAHSAIDLYCTVSHTRQSETCLYAYRYGVTYGGYCYVSGEYYGTEFDAEAIKSTYSSSACTWQAFYWMHDYSTGETWQLWSSEVQLWRCPS